MSDKAFIHARRLPDDAGAAVRLIEQIAGHPIPTIPFPVMITGVAKPKANTIIRPYPNSPLIDGLDCTDPAWADEDGYMEACFEYPAPDGDGFFPIEYLPCGVYPTRYRWRAQGFPFTSEGCGWRMKDAEDPHSWVPWRQLMYAVNTAHKTQDPALDYPYIRPGTIIPEMAFGRIDLLTGGVPTYGFYFHHMTDPFRGVIPCDQPPQVEDVGCCCWPDPEDPSLWICQCDLTRDECAGLDPNYEWCKSSDCTPAACQAFGDTGDQSVCD